MRRLSGIAILVWAACEGGSGARLEPAATLPSSTLGFDADGTPIVGFVTPPAPLLRFDGAVWAPHAAQMPFSVIAFGSDADGAPLVLHRAATGTQAEVWRIEPDGGAARLGDPVPATVRQVMQSGSGTRYMRGDLAIWVLRPGATTWQQDPSMLRIMIPGGDGRIYANLFSMPPVVRFEDDGTFIPTACSGQLLGADASGRIYLAGSASIHACDPETGRIDAIDLPEGSSIQHALVTDRYVVLSAVLDTEPGGAALFMSPVGAAGFAPVRLDPDVPASLAAPRLLAAPDGTIYAADGDWLGRIVEAR